MYKKMDKLKKCGKKKKYEEFTLNLSQGAAQRVQVPFESLSTAPRRSKRIKQNSDVKFYDSTTDYYAHSQGKSIFRDIESKYKKTVSTRDFPARFCEVLREQVPKSSKVKAKSIKNIKSLVGQIDSVLDGGTAEPQALVVPEDRWVFQTPCQRTETAPFGFNLPQSLSPEVDFFTGRASNHSFDLDSNCFS